MRVKVIKKDGKPVAVRAAVINGRVINIALKDEPNYLNWYNAVEKGYSVDSGMVGNLREF